MTREMIINVAESEECRVAVVDNGALEELYVERTSLNGHVGNIYKGKVANIDILNPSGNFILFKLIGYI